MISTDSGSYQPLGLLYLVLSKPAEGISIVSICYVIIAAIYCSQCPIEVYGLRMCVAGAVDTGQKWTAFAAEIRAGREREQSSFRTPEPAARPASPGPVPMSGVAFSGEPTVG